MRCLRLRYMATAAAMVFAGSANAGPIPYPHAGTQNAELYSFTATNDGDLTAYFVDSGGASFTNELSVLVNGVQSALQGLNNHTSAYGTALDFGPVHAGDAIVMEMVNLSPGNVGPWYSDKALNSDGANHVYSTGFAGDATIPKGIYVGFEDIAAPGADFNYHDATFVFTNVSAVPEPQAWGLALGGLGLVMIKVRRTRG